MKRLILVCLSTWLGAVGGAWAQDTAELADFDGLAATLQTLVDARDRAGFQTLLAPEADPDAARDFSQRALPDGVTRAVVQPQFLVPRETETESEDLEYELTLDVFTEMGSRARLDTWTLGVRALTPAEAGVEPDWRITSHRSLGGLDSLYHLALSSDTQFEATDLVIAGEDMTLSLRRGAVFVAETDAGVTALVLIGDGRIRFAPEPQAERDQVRIFAGDEVLETEFTHAYVRMNPEMYASRVATTALREVSVDQGELRRAQAIFDELAPLSYMVDLSDLSARGWWLTPSAGDFVAEIVTRRYGALTYLQARNAPEDVALYQREPGPRVISLYASARQRAVRGRYFDDQDGVAYDVLDYDVVASFEPRGVTQETLRARARLRGCWIEGATRIALRVTALNLTSLTLRLADALDVRSVSSRELGPLPFFRMSGQNNIVINLPSEAPNGTELSITVGYAGLLPPQEPDENWIGRSRFLFDGEATFGVGAERYIYSSSSHWYPQSTVADFATATMALTVPSDFGVVASGDAGEGGRPSPVAAGDGSTHTFEFMTLQPAKYLSAVISRFWPHDIPSREIALERETSTDDVWAGVRYNRMSLAVETNPRTRERLDEYYERTADILGFYSELIGDMPYPTFTLALTDSYLPGGHSPAYFAVLNQPLPLQPGMMWSWRTDPVAFSDVEYFFLAHELAHQWWGQAVGWKNYHEQWLSEAISQYFAALYVERDRGPEAFLDVLSQMRDWGMRHSAEGPVYLGYRLGLIEEEPRVYRSLVYNKGAVVLHMLRGLLGDDTFFRGLRRYYNEMRFARAGTDDLIRAFETEAARSLEEFFDRWIHDSDLPELRFDYRTEARDVVLRFEQTEKVFELPVTVTLEYRSGDEEDVIVPVTSPVTEIRHPLQGDLRRVEVNGDETALVEIRR